MRADPPDGKLHRASRRQFVSACAMCLASPLVPPLRALAVPQPSSPSNSSVIEDLVAANRILAAEQILAAFGHVSSRHPGDANRFLLARSVAPELVTAADIMEYDLDA